MDLLRKVIDFYMALLSPVQLAVLVVAGMIAVCILLAARKAV